MTEGDGICLTKRATPLRAGYPLATKGNQPTDGGFLLVENEDLAEVRADPIAAKYLRRYMQAKEFLWDELRHCLWLVDASPEELATSPVLQRRLENVRHLRETSQTARVRRCANTPHVFTQIRQPKERYLALPEVSSERRKWIPAAYLPPEVIAGNKLILIPGADLLLFGLLQSSMFMAWLRTVAGRLKSDISISADLTYCTFPFPEMRDEYRKAVERAAEEVLKARAKFVGKSLGELYEPEGMAAELVAAHEALDEAVDGGFGGPVRDELRAEVLLAELQKLLRIRPTTIQPAMHDHSTAEKSEHC